MNHPPINPVNWRLSTLLSLEVEQVHELACWAVGTLTSFRLILGRCLLALHENKGYKKFGCSTAAHYACSVLGINRRLARECKRVARQVQGLPELTLAAEDGKISWSKLREIVRKASPQTEEYWLELAGEYDADTIAHLIGRTAEGSIPGEPDQEEKCLANEFRFTANPQVIQMFQRVRRLLSLDQEKALNGAETLEYLLASFLSTQPLDPEGMKKIEREAEKDLQAESAQRIRAVMKARELAAEMGLMSIEQEATSYNECSPVELVARALGVESAGEPLQFETPGLEGGVNTDTRQARTADVPFAQNPSKGVAYCEPSELHCQESSLHRHSERPTRVISQPPASIPISSADPSTRCGHPGEDPLKSALSEFVVELEKSFRNDRLDFNPGSRHTTPGQKEEIFRRDGWSCSTPACPNRVWLHIHHIKPFSKGGPTTRRNLLSLCCGCHRNHHDGLLKITQENGKLIFRDQNGRRLDHQADLELAGWLDRWDGWRGGEDNSHQARFHRGEWAVFS